MGVVFWVTNLFEGVAWEKRFTREKECGEHVLKNWVKTFNASIYVIIICLALPPGLCLYGDSQMWCCGGGGGGGRVTPAK